ARELGISRHTVTTAYGRLVAEGYLAGRAGGGTEVSYGTARAYREERPTELHPRSLPHTDYVTPPPAAGGIDLRIGLPDRTLFPLPAWRRCVVTALQSAPAEGGDPAGHPDLRRTIANWIGRSRGVDADAGNVVVTAGAQHAVDLVATVFAGRGDRVAFEEPGYAPIRDLLATSGLKVVPVPVDTDGMVVDAIPTDVRLVYVTPSHQSPTGATMSLTRRRALLELADRHEMAIVEDDYDSEYRLGDRPLEPLYRLDRHGRVVYVGTFSKTLSPTLRLGFAVLPASLAPAVAKVAELNGAYPPLLVQVAMRHFIVDGHLGRHLRRARRVYAERHEVVARFVEQAVLEGLVEAGPTTHAGLHLSVRLPGDVPQQDVVDACRRKGVALTSMKHSWMGQPTGQFLLIGYGRASPAQLQRGLGVVGDVLRGLGAT
ncbi:MAG TPA: PLP-dependent aminotransferase family protein, partial [Ilumatobacteraceae bacterium]|nr:PLP-dependent aminotransferase family protein [Ilumatobacteraceae bacterium]